VFPIHPELAEKWHPIKQMLFYKTMGISNSAESEMSNTWVPFFGIVSPENADFFNSFAILRDPDTNNRVSVPNGYVIKMSAFYQYHNWMAAAAAGTGFSAKRDYYARDISDLFRNFIQARPDSQEWRNPSWFSHTVSKCMNYFSETAQMQMSIRLSPESALWRNNPELVAFIMETALWAPQPPSDYPPPELGEAELAALASNTLLYTPETFVSIAGKMDFALQTEITATKQKILMDERKRAAISRAKTAQK